MAGSSIDKQHISWKEVAIDLQQNFLCIFGESDWDAFEYTERAWLEKRVGHALHGPPEVVPAKGDCNETGYNRKQLENIQKVCAAIIKEDMHGQEGKGETWMTIIFVCMEIPLIEGEELCVKPVPIFKVPKYINGSVETVSFIDSNARVYCNWEDFLKHNELPKCNYCYPWEGVYEGDGNGNVLVDFGKSPACKISKKVLTALDQTSTVVAVGTTAISMASFFVPVAGPFIAASVWGGMSVGIYGAARSTGALLDRRKHNQSIDVKDSEARNCWLSLVGNALGAASAKAVNSVAKLAQTGQVISKTGCLAVNALNVGSLAVNGIGIVNGAFILREKYKNDELTPLDVFQFSSSVLFFAHAAVNMKTADTIIKDTQNSVLREYEANLRSNRHRKMFRKVARNTGKDMNGIEGNAKVIRGLMHIENKDDFFAGLVRVDKQFRSTQSKVILTETGHVEINHELSIDPMTFYDINKDQRQVILQATKNLAEGAWSETQFKTVIEPITQEQNIQFHYQRSEDSMSDISKVLGANNTKKIFSSGQRALSNISSFDKVNVLKEIMKNFDNVLHNSLLQLAIRLSGLMRWTHKLRDVLEFVCQAVADIASKMEHRYQDDLRNAMNIFGSNFCQDDFDRNYQIEGKRFKHFCTIVIDKYIKNPVLISYLIGAFEQRRNSLMNPETVGTSEMLRPYVRSHNFWVDNECQCLMPHEIFSIVHEATGLEVDGTNCMLEYDGLDVNVVMDPGMGITSVLIRSNIEQETVTAHVNY